MQSQTQRHQAHNNTCISVKLFIEHISSGSSFRRLCLRPRNSRFSSFAMSPESASKRFRPSSRCFSDFRVKTGPGTCRMQKQNGYHDENNQYELRTNLFQSIVRKIKLGESG